LRKTASLQAVSALITIALTTAFSISATNQIEVGPPILLNSNGRTDIGNDVNPQVTTDGHGVWIAVWHSYENLDGVAGVDSDIFLARSLDNGRTWTSPMLLNTNAKSDSGSDELPQITTDRKGHWVATWYSSEDLYDIAGDDTDIFVATSNDNGATWTPPSLLNTNGTTDRGDDAWPQITTDGLGIWIAVWWSRENLEGNTGKDVDIFTATSLDNGVTWSKPKFLHTNATTDSGTDSEPRLTTDGSGNWIAVWRTSQSTEQGVESDTDIVIVRSSDNGTHWTEPTLLNAYGYTDTGDDNYPVVETDGAGNWVAVWRSDENIGGVAGTDRDIIVATSNDDGLTWSSPVLLNSNGASDSGKDQIPQVTTDKAGNWISVWWSDDDLGGEAGTDNDIFMALSRDNGATWSHPSLLNTTGSSDTGGDFVPQLTTDGKGNWIAIWDSEDDFGETVGSDADIFVASFFIAIEKDDSVPK